MAKNAPKPKLFLIAGINGTGKTTFYEKNIAPYNKGMLFINADSIEKDKWPDQIGKRSYDAQKLAEEQRLDQLSKKKSFATETVFSHPSKLNFIKDAQQAGYDVYFIFINVKDTDTAISRVKDRVAKGGHDVPVEKIKSRHPRTLANAKIAAQLADKTLVFDNSGHGRKHRVVMEMSKGRITHLKKDVPEWAQAVFKSALAVHKISKMEPVAASFLAAKRQAKLVLGEGAQITQARKNTAYEGKLLARTPKHLVQQTGEKTAVAHFRTPELDALRLRSTVKIDYDHSSRIKVTQRGRDIEDSDRSR